MKTIPLTQGQEAICDDDDFPWLSLRKWHAHWNPRTKSYYAATYKNGRKHLMSRVIMNTVHFLQCDHKNHDTLDHRRKNLQNVTNRQNQENRRDQSKHGVGVELLKRGHELKKPFAAYATIDGAVKRNYLGLFTTAAEAQEARGKFLADPAAYKLPKFRPSKYGTCVYKLHGNLKKPFGVRVGSGGDRVFLGYFATAEEAQEAREKYIRENGGK